MEEKKIKHSAIRMKKKQAKKLAELKHCCIPSTVVKTETVEYEDGSIQVVNPDIKSNGNGTFGKAGEYYKEIKAKRVKYLDASYSGKTVKGHKKRRKQPWYMLTSGKCYNYEERHASFGAHTKCYRVKSEQKIFHDLYTIPKFTKEELTIRLLRARMKAWELKNPMPPKDMFYWQEMKPWVNRYQQKLSQVAGAMGLMKDNLPTYFNEMYNKYEIQFNEEYAEHQKEINKAA